MRNFTASLNLTFYRRKSAKSLDLVNEIEPKNEIYVRSHGQQIENDENFVDEALI